MSTPSKRASAAAPIVIAVVGLSMKPDRPSHEVAAYMQRHGYRIIPVNPMYAGTYILDERCYASLTEAVAAVEQEGLKIAIVDCFRKSSAIGPIVDDVIALGAPCIWLQLGVINQEAADRASAAGIQVIMDRCIKIEHRQGRWHGVL